MAVKIAVLAKQVLDPEMPMAAFHVDPEARRVVAPPNIPPVVNGFDENAVEAALQIKDGQEATITVISTGTSTRVRESEVRTTDSNTQSQDQTASVDFSHSTGCSTGT